MQSAPRRGGAAAAAPGNRAAKAIAALAASRAESDIWPFVRGEPREGQLKGALPLAAIPTTAATASEVTPYAVISNRTLKGKSVLAHEFLVSDRSRSPER